MSCEWRDQVKRHCIRKLRDDRERKREREREIEEDRMMGRQCEKERKTEINREKIDLMTIMYVLIYF